MREILSAVERRRNHWVMVGPPPTPHCAVQARAYQEHKQHKKQTVLLDGHSRSATELGIISGVAFNTASTHLSKLVDAGLVTFEQDGRHRFHRILGSDFVDVMEALHELLPGQRQLEQPLTEIEMARTCYDHLAGRLGASLTDVLVSRGYLCPQDKNFLLSEEGEAFFSTFGVDLEIANRQRRMFARRCLDWTDKRDHLGGALGAALARQCFAMGWVQPGHHPRLVQVTKLGIEAFRDRFGLLTSYSGRGLFSTPCGGTS